MKSIKNFSLIALVIAGVFTSCTIEKRLYNYGYHVEWKKNNRHADAEESVNLEKTAQEQKEAVKQPKKEAQPLDVAPINVETKHEVKAVSNDTPEAIATKKSTPATYSKKNTASAKVKPVSKFKQDLAKKAITKAVNKKSSSSDDIPIGLLYVLCFVFPCLAVGFATDWDMGKVLLNFLLTLLCVIPGIIHACVVVSKSR